MKINNKFIPAEKLGEKLKIMMSHGYDITVEIFDITGDGRIIFEHDDCSTKYVSFTKITYRDEVEIENNNLGLIIRKYEE